MSEKISCGRYFSAAEMMCKCGCGKILFDANLIRKLDSLRQRLGRPVYISSGYRCASHNRAVGGVENSYHTRGQAADIYVNGITPKALAKLAEEAGFDGIGTYSTFVHVDVRGYRARWNG